LSQISDIVKYVNEQNYTNFAIIEDSQKQQKLGVS